MENPLMFLKHRLKKTAIALFPKQKAYIPIYRICEIKETEAGSYEVFVQAIGTQSIVKFKPEEILSDDYLTEKFSPIDVRTLTFLGYLDINNPKYRILAQRLSEKDNKVIFVLHEKGTKKIELKKANEISKNGELLNGLTKDDINLISYTAGTEAVVDEKKDREKLFKELKDG